MAPPVQLFSGDGDDINPDLFQQVCKLLVWDIVILAMNNHNKVGMK